MKKSIFTMAAAFLSLGLVTASAQFGGAGHQPGALNFNGAIGKLFGDNQAFTASLQFQTTDPAGNEITLPGKISFDTGKSRFEMNMADVKGTKMPPNAIEQFKRMGMDSVVSVSCPDQKAVYIIYPGMQSYVENPMTEPADDASADFKVETKELGKETVAGHECVKNQVTVTGKDGQKHEFTVWNATDLNHFPVKLETLEQGRKGTMTFTDVSFKKPAASAFEAPADYKKYTNMQEMMRAVMMKQMGHAPAQPH